MNYEKQTWQTGDIVTSAKLNHMEDGIAESELPSVTSADEGKVLTVEEKSVQGAVLVPEETFVFTDGIMAEINMQNKSLFVEGAECLLTVDSTTTTVTVQTVSEPESGLMIQDNEIGITILLEDGTNVSKLYVPNVGTYTVSLYIEGTEYVWTPANGSGGGVIYKTITVTETPTERTYSMNISYQDFIDAIANNQIYIFQFEKRGGTWLYQPILYAPNGDAYGIMIASFLGPQEDGIFQANSINDTLTLIELIEDNG